MIDIHSHLIWGVDDGASCLEVSMVMLEGAREAGTTDIVATPHSNTQFAYQPELVRQRIAELTERMGGSPKIHCGCEFQLNFDNLAQLLEQPSVYTIDGGPYLLLECPDFHVGSHTEKVFQRLLEARITPIIAHPERNPMLRQKLERLGEWVDAGCLLQVTSLSITGGFGGSAKSAAIRLLDQGLAHVIASDAHDPVHRHARLDEAYRAVSSRWDEDFAELLFVDNPRAVVEGRPVQAERPEIQESTDSVGLRFWKRWSER